LDKDLSPEQLAELQKDLAKRPFVLAKEDSTHLRFISNKEAAETFIKNTGEDFTKFLEDNFNESKRTINRIKGFNFHKILFNQNSEEKYLPNEISGNKKFDLENVSTKDKEDKKTEEQFIFEQILKKDFHLEIKNIQDMFYNNCNYDEILENNKQSGNGCEKLRRS
jgi:hypothetical protein